jgi:hypothetical protein
MSQRQRMYAPTEIPDPPAEILKLLKNSSVPTGTKICGTGTKPGMNPVIEKIILPTGEIIRGNTPAVMPKMSTVSEEILKRVNTGTTPGMNPVIEKISPTGKIIRVNTGTTPKMFPVIEKIPPTGKIIRGNTPAVMGSAIIKSSGNTPPAVMGSAIIKSSSYPKPDMLKMSTIAEEILKRVNTGTTPKMFPVIENPKLERITRPRENVVNRTDMGPIIMNNLANIESKDMDSSIRATLANVESADMDSKLLNTNVITEKYTDEIKKLNDINTEVIENAMSDGVKIDDIRADFLSDFKTDDNIKDLFYEIQDEMPYLYEISQLDTTNPNYIKLKNDLYKNTNIIIEKENLNVVIANKINEGFKGLTKDSKSVEGFVAELKTDENMKKTLNDLKQKMPYLYEISQLDTTDPNYINLKKDFNKMVNKNYKNFSIASIIYPYMR